MKGRGCSSGAVHKPDGITLISWVRSLKVMLGKALLRLGHDTPNWQKGFLIMSCVQERGYAEKMDYIRQNPVRTGLAADPDLWPYQGEIHPANF